MDAHLIIVGGNASKDRIELKLPTVIGRSKEATLTIAHPMVSRRHCELFEDHGLLMVRDKDSLNGTVVGKQRIKLAPLPPNAEITVGPLTFRVEYQYKGDLKKLPAPVLAETPVAGAQSPQTAASASPDMAIDFEEMGLPDIEQDGVSLFFEDPAEEPATPVPASPSPAKPAKPAAASASKGADAVTPPEEDAPVEAKKQKRSWLGGLLGKKKAAKEESPSEETDETPVAAPPKPQVAANSEPVTVPAPTQQSASKEQSGPKKKDVTIAEPPKSKPPAAAAKSPAKVAAKKPAKKEDDEAIDFLAVPDDDAIGDVAEGEADASDDSEDPFEDFLKDL